MQGICDRDRSGPAGRSHFLIAYPSLYILLCYCQGVVGHWEQDFDAGTDLSDIYLHVTEVLFRHSILYPKAPFGIQMQAIQDREQVALIPSNSQNITLYLDYNHHINP